jgi:hypothetical protein
MKGLVFVMAILHGLIHLLGFVKGFGISEVRELTLPISKSMGVLWLSAAILFLLYAVLYKANSQYAWLVGIIAVVVSQVLVILFWQDAKMGTLPNILFLVISIFLYGSYGFQKRIHSETEVILNQSNAPGGKIVTEEDIETLPAPVQNWLRNSGVVGLPAVTAGKVLQQAEMKLKPEQEKWMTATAVQFTTIDNPAFIWSVDVKMNRFLSFRGRDKFENGKGEMLIKLNSLISVVNQRGDKLNEGTIQRYLGEMVWFPWLALTEHIRWEQVDDNTAKATMTYQGTTGTGTFFFNDQGDVTKFSAMRYNGNEAGSRRYEWIMQIDGYDTFEGIRVPTSMSATWKFDKGDWTWLKLKVPEIRYSGVKNGHDKIQANV